MHRTGSSAAENLSAERWEDIMSGELDRERWLQLARANAEVIRTEIIKLRGFVEGDSAAQYVDFWAQAREITSQFKSFKPLEPEEREQLWKDFHDLCKQTRSRQDGERARLREESQLKRAAIEALTEEAVTLNEQASTLEELERAQSALNQALALMKNQDPLSVSSAAAEEVSAEDEKTEGDSGSPHPSGADPLVAARLLKEDRESCWIRWLEVREAIRKHRSEFRQKLFGELEERAATLLAASESEEPHGVQGQIRDFQSELKGSPMPPPKTEKIRETLRNAWKRCSDRIEEGRQQRRRQHDDWVERMREHLQRWEITLLKNQFYQERLAAEIADLDTRIASATEPGLSERMTRWAEEKRGRMEKVKETATELQEKVRSVRSRLGKDAPPPLKAEDLPPGTLEAAAPREPREPRADDAPRRERPAPRAARRSEERPLKMKETPPPGLNLGELLAEKLGLVVAGSNSDGDH